MPHYRDGTRAELLDEVIAHEYGRPVSGVVCQIVESAGTCNLLVAHAAAREFYAYRDGKNVLTHKLPELRYGTFTAAECERADLHAKRVAISPPA